MPITIAIRHLDAAPDPEGPDPEATLLGEVLLSPEVSRLGTPRSVLGEGLAESLRVRLERQGPKDAQARVLPGEPAVLAIDLAVPVPRGSRSWTGPFPLRLHAVRWRHAPSGPWVARLPALGIEVTAQREEDLQKILERHAELALARRPAGVPLPDLVELDREAALTLETRAVAASLPTPLEAARSGSGAFPGEAGGAGTGADVEGELARVADDLRAGAARRQRARRGRPWQAAYACEARVEALARRVADPARPCLLLVGESGSGKSALVEELARRAAQLGLADRPVLRTSGARLVAGMGGFGEGPERVRRLVAEAARRDAVLDLGNLFELSQVGRGEGDSTGLAGWLRGSLDQGRFTALAEATPGEKARLERDEPRLLSAFESITVPGAGAGEMLEILAAVAREDAHPGAPEPVEPAALVRVRDLYARYAPYSARPGLPVRFLRDLLAGRDRDAGAVDLADVEAAFGRATGLPDVLLHDARPLPVEPLRVRFSERILGQPDAVSVIADAIVAVKSGLARPGRPLASFLLAGPSGVGKTETAKCLAEFFFGDAARLTRLDLSEYADAGSASRLVGSLGRGRDGEGVLTARIREQPFTVLLLDELEKAHPDVFDLLLQVLGEARLTDGSGRLADFGSTVVVMTSNLGAGEFGRAVPGKPGEGGSPARLDPEGAVRHFTAAVTDWFRPELVGRIDRIVPFLPLERDTLRRLAARELAELTAREGLAARPITVQVAPEALDVLVGLGHDARYGARPLRAAVSRHVGVPLSVLLNERSRETACTVRIEAASGGELSLRVEESGGEAERARQAGLASRRQAADSLSRLRRRIAALLRSDRLAVLRDERDRLVRGMARRVKRRGRVSRPPSAEELTRLSRLEPVLSGLDRLAARLEAAEDRSVLRLAASLAGMGGPAPSPPGAGTAPREGDPAAAPGDEEAASAFAAGVEDALLDLLGLQVPDPDRITLLLAGRHGPSRHELATAILAAARWLVGPDGDLTARAVGYRLGKAAAPAPPGSPLGSGSADVPPEVLVGSLLQAEDLLARGPGEGLGLGLELVAPRLALRLSPAAGSWLVTGPQGPEQVVVRAVAERLAAWRPTVVDLDLPLARAQDQDRVVRLATRELEDRRLGRSFPWSGRELGRVLARAFAEALARRLAEEFPG